MISVIIPNHNSGPLLKRCLHSLEQQVTDEVFEVIVVDDGSRDESAQSASLFPGVTLIRQEYMGACAARNRGLQAARGRLILFLDSDCSAWSNWIREISSRLVAQESLVTVGRFISSQTGLIPRLVQQELEERFRRMKRHGDVDFLNSATCGFVRQVIEQYRFDPDFDKLEDVDLSFRLAAAGIDIRYVPTAIVDHHHPGSLWAYLRRKFRYGRTAPLLYKRFPRKSLGDASTPPTRRFQLALVLLGILTLPFSWMSGASMVGVALALTFPAAFRAWASSPLLAVLYPPFALIGSFAFVVGWGVGTASLLMHLHPAKPKNSFRAKD